MKTKILFGVCGLVLVVGASVATAQRGEGRDGFDGRRARVMRIARHMRALRGQHARGEIARRLGVTEEQRAAAREVAQQIRPLAEALRPQVREILTRVKALARAGDHEGARNLVKTELKPLIENARARTRPLVQPLIEALTPEQRAKIEAACRARGRTFDEAKLADRLALRLARAGRGARAERR